MVGDLHCYAASHDCGLRAQSLLRSFEVSTWRSGGMFTDRHDLLGRILRRSAATRLSFLSAQPYLLAADYGGSPSDAWPAIDHEPEECRNVVVESKS